MRCRLLLLMFAVSVCQSVTQLKLAAHAACAGVIQCSLCQITLAFAKLLWLLVTEYLQECIRLQI